MDYYLSTTKCPLISIQSLCQDEEESFIILRVQMQKEADVCYRIGQTTPLTRLMADYCRRMGCPYGTLRFSFDGTRVAETDSPFSLKMENYDIIDAWKEQIGGA